MFRFDGAKIHFFPDILTVSVDFLMRRSVRGRKGGWPSARRGFRGRPPWGYLEHIIPDTMC